jgi:hypothetical protein
MNHRPFEDWLINHQPLTPAEKLDLDAHIRSCKSCCALAETGLILRSTRMASPAAGFATRFEKRLAAHKIAERQRKLWGLIVFVLVGAGLLLWLTVPLVVAFLAAPAQWITAGIGYWLFLIASIQSFGETLQVTLRVVPGFIPPILWMMIASALAGFGLLWTVSLWRFSRLATRKV